MYTISIFHMTMQNDFWNEIVFPNHIFTCDQDKIWAQIWLTSSQEYAFFRQKWRKGIIRKGGKETKE